MGEIAEMHIKAWEAGLDPNEMDGADWADFLAHDDEPLTETDEEAAEMFASECRTWMCPLLLERGQEGDTLDAILRRVYPQLTEGQASGFVAVLGAIDGLPTDDA